MVIVGEWKHPSLCKIKIQTYFLNTGQLENIWIVFCRGSCTWALKGSWFNWMWPTVPSMEANVNVSWPEILTVAGTATLASLKHSKSSLTAPRTLFSYMLASLFFFSHRATRGQILPCSVGREFHRKSLIGINVVSLNLLWHISNSWFTANHTCCVSSLPVWSNSSDKWHTPDSVIYISPQITIHVTAQ